MGDDMQVQGRLQTLKERLFEHVEEVLDFSREPTLTAVRSGRWRSVFDKAVQFFTRRGGEASSSRVDMQAKLQDLHDSINAQIEAEVSRVKACSSQSTCTSV